MSMSIYVLVLVLFHDAAFAFVLVLVLVQYVAFVSLSLSFSGADIETPADAFRYVYQNANGDVTIVARVATQQNTDYWAKTGVMDWESTAAGSVNAAVLMTPEGGVVFQCHTSTGGSTSVSRVKGVTTPQWVKLVRRGSKLCFGVPLRQWKRMDPN
jgi:hypothetical protein